MPLINERRRGFFTIAQDNDKTDYVRLAYGLALSLRRSQIAVPYLSIGVSPGTQVDEKYAWAFDNIIEIPWGDHAKDSTWKLENEWKSIWMTPYEETIKLDADMLFFSDISQWWEVLGNQGREMVWTNSVIDWKGDRITSDYYRKTFTDSLLPNIYTAMGYFRKTAFCFSFFELARTIFWNWEAFYGQFLEAESRPSHPSTDVIFALASKIIDIEQTDYRERVLPTFCHMKTHLQGWQGEDLSEDWRSHVPIFFNDNAECKIGNHRQLYPLHYHVKEFLTDEIIHKYERLLKPDGIPNI